MRTALVFGGSGQIGVRIVAGLIAQGWRVFAVSRQARPDGERLTWLQGALQHPPPLPMQVDAIFSAGPLDHFAQWYELARHPAGRIIAFGSTSLQTKQDSSDGGERDIAARLGDAETRIFEVTASLRAQATLLRPTLVYGAGRDRSLSQIAALARRAGFFVLPNDALGLRQPVHVQDLADAALAALEASASYGRSYALPGGERLTYMDMTRRTLSALQPPARLVQVPPRLFDMALWAAHRLGRLQALGAAAVSRMREDLVFDPEPARSDFGYAPRPFHPTQDMFT